MLDCRRCGNGTMVVAEEPATPAGDGSQTVRRTRECVGCSARAETTEAWSDEDAVEFYLARYQQTAEWIGNLGFLLKAPAATAKMAEDWVRQDLERLAAGLGPAGPGAARRRLGTGKDRRPSENRLQGPKEEREVPKLPTPPSGVLMAVWSVPRRRRSREGHRRRNPRQRRRRLISRPRGDHGTAPRRTPLAAF